MKIEYQGDKIIIYLYRYKINLNNLEKLNEDVKNVFIKLIKTYRLNLFGYSKVHLYENKKYGIIFEIEKVYQGDFLKEIIDLKLLLHEDATFYLEMESYPLDKKNDDIFYQNGKFYWNIEKIDNLLKYLELGRIIYDKK